MKLKPLSLLATTLLASAAIGSASAKPPPPFEMWLFDQSRTDHTDADADGNFRDGGTLRIFKGNWLGGITAAPAETINLATVPTAGGAGLGERPHIGGSNFAKTHVALSYFGTSHVDSGGIDIFRISDRTVVASYRGMGALHMPGPSPDDTKMAGVSIGQNLLHLIPTDYATETFGAANTFNLTTTIFPGVGNPTGATLPTLLGTTTAAPICSNFTWDSKHLFITMQGGGMAIFNVEDITTPQLTEVYSSTYADAASGTNGIPGEGCGLIQHPDRSKNLMYTYSGVSSGSAAFLGNPEYTHVWNMATVGDGVLNDLVKTVDMGVSFSTGGVDSWGDLHGPNFALSGRYLWTIVRVDSAVKVIDTRTNQLVSTFSLASPFSSNPTPDVLERSPINPYRMWYTNRGFCPLSGPTRFVDRSVTGEPNCPVAAGGEVAVSGRNPGLSTMRVALNGKSGTTISHYRVDNVVYADANGAPLATPINITEPHAGKIVVRSALLPPQ